MSDPEGLQDLIGYLVRTSRLSASEAQRVVAEVLNYLRETPEDFVRRRHLALQAEGLPPRLSAETPARRVIDMTLQEATVFIKDQRPLNRAKRSRASVEAETCTSPGDQR